MRYKWILIRQTDNRNSKRKFIYLFLLFFFKKRLFTFKQWQTNGTRGEWGKTQSEKFILRWQSRRKKMFSLRIVIHILLLLVAHCVHIFFFFISYLFIFFFCFVYMFCCALYYDYYGYYWDKIGRPYLYLLLIRKQRKKKILQYFMKKITNNVIKCNKYLCDLFFFFFYFSIYALLLFLFDNVLFQWKVFETDLTGIQTHTHTDMRK